MVKAFHKEIEPIDLLISAAIQKSKSIKLIDIGGLDYLHENIEVVNSSRFLPEIMKMLIKEIGTAKDIEKFKIENILLSSLRCCNDIFSIQEVINIMDFSENSIANLKDLCFNIFLDETKNIMKESVVRYWLLEAAFRFSLRDISKRFKLISYLINISLEDCEVYLKHVSKIIGLSYSSWQECELIDKLKEIKNSNKKLDDVWFELGMCYLLIALNSETSKDAISNFMLAKEHFNESILLNSERQDAIAYDACISILLSQNSSQLEINNNVYIDKLKRSITIYSGWHISKNDNIWMFARFTEMVNWYDLIEKLNALLFHFKEPSWLEPKIIIETYLLKIYSASRSILKKNNYGGLEKVIQPKIEATLIRQSDKLYLLDKWFELQGDTDLSLIAQKLKSNLKKFKSKFASNLEETFFEINNSIDAQSKTEGYKLYQFLEDCNACNQSEINPTIENILNNVIESIEQITSYQTDRVRRAFHILLNQTLKFLESRMNMTIKDFKRLEYLFDQDVLPLENALQEDYFQYLQGNISNANVSVEMNNISGGRIDVNISFGTFNFSAEIKRDWVDCSFEAIRSKYLGQAAEYSNTNVKLGFLLVLDLTPKHHGVRSIESCVKVEIIEKENDPIKRAIVVIIIPGKKKKPSNVKLKV